MKTELRDLLAHATAKIDDLEKQIAVRDAEIEALQAQLAKAKSRALAVAVASSFGEPRKHPLPVVAKPGTKLKRLRERLGLTQQALGERLGVARTTIANYENGRAPLSKRIKKWIEHHEASKERASGTAPRPRFELGSGS